MSFFIANPSPILSPYIKHYWGIDLCIPIGYKKTQRIVPSGLPELIFYFGQKPVSLDNEKNISDFTCISGQQKNYYDISVRGEFSVFSVLLKPHALPLFFNLPANELFNINIPLRYIIKSEVSEIEDKLATAKTFIQRRELIEVFLINLLKKKNWLYEFERMDYGINYINYARGLVEINHLADKICVSRKQLERTFHDLIGTSPKQFLKTIRFQNALNLKQKTPQLNLTSLAYSAGYYDQAHMINDFKQLSGYTPKQYFAECDPISDYFHGSDLSVIHNP